MTTIKIISINHKVNFDYTSGMISELKKLKYPLIAPVVDGEKDDLCNAIVRVGGREYSTHWFITETP